MKIFGVIFFSLIFTVVLFMASTLGMSLLWIEFHNHTGQDPLRLKFVFEDIFLIPNVLIFVSIWFIYIKVKIRNIRKEQEQKRILDENLFFERKEKKIAEEKIRKEKEKEKQKAEDKRIKEEQEQKRILDEERKEKKIAEEKIRKEKEKEKQKAEDKKIKEEQEQKRILDEERKAKKIAEEKTRKEEEKQNNGYYIEIDTNGKTEISGPFEEKKIKDFFDAGKLNLTSKIKKGVKTKSFSSLSTFKTFTEGLDDWL